MRSFGFFNVRRVGIPFRIRELTPSPLSRVRSSSPISSPLASTPRTASPLASPSTPRTLLPSSSKRSRFGKRFSERYHEADKKHYDLLENK